jgi:hypothetical protein
VIDEMLVEIFGEVALGRLGRSRRAQLLCRVFFGLLGAALSAGGAVYFVLRHDIAAANGAMRICMVAMFIFFGCFWLFNVALARQWRWPGAMFAVSFVSLFVTRIAFGP